MYTQTKWYLILITLSLISCNEENKIEKVALDFHEFYINNIDSENNKIVNFQENLNRKNIIDIDAYINRLQKSPSISHEFIDNEKKRLNHCLDYLSNQTSKTFREPERHLERSGCDYIYYYQWLKEHENPTILIDKITKNEAVWNVSTILVFDNTKGEKCYKTNPIRFFIKRENGVYKVVNIKWVL